MNKSQIRTGLVRTLAIALLILAPVLAQGESRTTGKQPKKDESDEKLIRVYAEDKEGNKKFKLIANRDEALPIIFAAYENLSSQRLQWNLLKWLTNHYKGTKYEKQIMAFLKQQFCDNFSPRKKGELLITGLCVNSKHSVTKLMLAKAANTEGEDKGHKRLRRLAGDIRKYFDTGDEDLLERWRLSPEALKPPEDNSSSQKQKKSDDEG